MQNFDIINILCMKPRIKEPMNEGFLLKPQKLESTNKSIVTVITTILLTGPRWLNELGSCRARVAQ